MRLKEETVIFISVVRWIVLATVAGAVIGLGVALFLKALTISSDFAKRYRYYYLLAPVAFFVSAYIIERLAPDAEGHGTEKVIEAVHKRAGRIKAMVIPVKLVSTIVTLALGGSVGKEGPCAQIGGGFSSLIADALKFTDADRKKLVVCGISGGFAAVFGTPIAGALFGIEVLFIGNMLYEVLLPSFVSGIISYKVSSEFGIMYFRHPLNFVPSMSEEFLLKMVLAGIIFGFCSFIFVETMNFGHKISSRIKLSKPVKGLIGGAVIIVLTLIFSQKYLGLGLDVTEAALNGKGPVEWYTFFIKAVFTSVTLNFGGSGGIVTPIFFAGATAGLAFSNLLGVDPATLSAIGMVSVVAGTTNAPIAASVMAVEMFGAPIVPYAAIAAVLSYVITGHRSVYPSQVLAIKKSVFLEVELGKEIEDTRPPEYLQEDRSLKGLLASIWAILSGRKPRG